MKYITYTIFALMVCSCGDNTTTKYRVFRYNQANHISSLDPAFAKSQNNTWATHHLYNGLLRLDDSLNIKGDIAHSWKVSDDGKTYTFILRDDVYFHRDPCFGKDSSRRVTAYDVAYSLQRLVSPDVNSPGAWLFSDKVDTSGFTAVDDTTFRLRLKIPFMPLLGILTMQYCSVVPREAVEYYAGDFKSHPVGTGPFRFKHWETNQALFLNKNPHYFRETKHNLDGIKTTFIADKKIAFLELLQGNIDFVSGLESSFIQELLDGEGNLKEDKKEKIRFMKAPYLNFEYIGINSQATPEDSPLRHKAFRQALNYGIDRKTMLRSLRNNVGVPAHSGAIPIGLPDYDLSTIGYTYNPEKASALIQSLQLPELPVLQLYTNKDYLDLTTYIAKQWEDIGVMSEIIIQESSILRDGMRKGSIPMFRASWIADYPDAESFLCLFYSGYPAPPNYSRYANPKYDALYEASIKESIPEKRAQMHRLMNEMIIEDAPVIFLFYDESALFSTKRTSGVSSNAINLLKVEDIHIGS